MKMSIYVDQFSSVQKLATLTQLYLELGLRLHGALRAAEADVWQPEEMAMVFKDSGHRSRRPIGDQEHPITTQGCLNVTP